MSRFAYDKITKQSTLIAGSTNPVVIAGTERTSTASQPYTVGQYLVYNGFLYKVISAIAQGDAFVIGTNISVTTVGDEITNHLVVNGTEFYFDSHDGVFGYNTSPNRGADTFVPFSSGGNYIVCISSLRLIWSYSGVPTNIEGSISTVVRVIDTKTNTLVCFFPDYNTLLYQATVTTGSSNKYSFGWKETVIKTYYSGNIDDALAYSITDLHQTYWGSAGSAPSQAYYQANHVLELRKTSGSSDVSFTVTAFPYAADGSWSGSSYSMGTKFISSSISVI